MDDLNGRVAVVTGAASGIGLATARAFAGAGMKLVLADTNAEKLREASASLEQAGAEVLVVQTDVSDRSAVLALAAETWARFGAAHVVFNNAGVAVFGRVDTLSHADWMWSLNVNLWGVIHGVEAFLPRLIAQNEPAHIVNSSSFAGLVTSVNMAAYNVAKAGVVALTESLRKDLRHTSIGTSVLLPMRVATNVWQTSAHNRPAELGGSASFRARPPEETAEMSGGVGHVDDTAEMVLKAVRTNQLYVHTHQEARPILRRRFDKLDLAFDA